MQSLPVVRSVLLCLLLGCLPTQWAFSAAQIEHVSVGDFALLDHTGKFHQLSYYGDQAGLVLLTQGNDPYATSNSLPYFRALREQYARQDVQFFLLNAMPGAKPDVIPQTKKVAVAQDAGPEQIETPILIDSAQLVAESLALTRLDELVIINPRDMTLVYRAELTADTTLIRQVLDALVRGDTWNEPAAQLGAAPEALRIPFPSRDLHAAKGVSYTRDIVPILKDNCVPCHQEGGIAPWAMNRHLMVQGFAPMIKEVVATRRMPPGQIDQQLSKPIHEVAGLTVAEQQKTRSLD